MSIETVATTAGANSTAQPNTDVGHIDGPSGDSAGSIVAAANDAASRDNDQNEGTSENPNVLDISVVTTKKLPLIMVRILLSSSLKTCQNSMSNEKH